MSLMQLQRELAIALREEQDADNAAANAKADYDRKLAEFEAENQHLVIARDTAATRQSVAKSRVKELRDKANELLRAGFIDEELPEGFVQKRTKEVRYDAQGLRDIAIRYFPFLLQLNTKLVHTFFTAMAAEQKDGALILPEEIRSLAAVEVVYVPLVNISNSTLLKLNIDNTNSPAGDSAEQQAEKHLEGFAEANNIDVEQPTDLESEAVSVEEIP